MTADVLVLGGGVAGLACRYGLAGHREVVLLEREPEAGGLLRVHPAGPYVFDSTVHVLFFRDDARKRLVLDLLDDDVRTFQKVNAIWQDGREIPYPYQFHAHALPPEVRERCLALFPREGTDLPPDASFEAWLRAQFGDGFYDAFFRPYNEKLYGIPLHTLEAAPMTWMIPSDDRTAVLAGATEPLPRPAPTVFYPRGSRGIARLTDALMGRGTGSVRLGDAVARVDLRERWVETASGRRLAYRDLVSSLPLPAFLRLVRDLPPEVDRAARAMTSASVFVVEVGAPRDGGALPAHWTYLPDPDVPFYRLIRLERISPDLAPPGGVALLLEGTGERVPSREEALTWLHGLGVLAAPEANHVAVRRIEHAYVRFTHGYREARETTLGFLREAGVHSIGRYGEWRYASIAQALASGLDAADRLS